jgi:ribosomal protein S18 acetylase RimI-like enzyme
MNSSRNASSRRSFSSRGYRDEKDLIDMQRFLMAARSRTDDWHYCHVGELQFAFFMVLCHMDPQQHIRLWHDPAGGLIAYAILGEDPSLDWQVSPEQEWTGIESQALAWAETRVAELRTQDPRAWGGPLVSGSREDNAERLGFLESHGFRYKGEFAEVNMIRSLRDPIPEAPLPAGYQVRPVSETGELTRRAAAQREVWHPWTVGNVTDEDYTRFMRLPGYDRDLDLVAAAPDGAIAAYVNGWVDPVNRIGDFGPVGALPAFRRLGLTRAVLLEGLRRMRSRGMDRVCVSTTVTNTPARGLYESIGFRIVNRYLDFTKAECFESERAGVPDGGPARK